MRKVLSVLLLFILAITSIYIPAVVPASAVEIVGAESNVLDDLLKNNNFNKDSYTSDINDPSLNVITLAESDDDKLYVYVHQPSGETLDLKASKIKISKDSTLDFKVYDLEFVNCKDVFYKYLVKGFTISDETKRTYEVTTIHRPYNETLDKSNSNIDDSQVINHVYYEVSKSFCFDSNGLKFVDDIQVVKIDNKFCGFIRCEEGWKLFTDYSVDLHFVAFSSSNFDIDHIYEADIYYEYQTCTVAETLFPYGYNEDFGNKESLIAKLDNSKTLESNGRGWFSQDYKQECILSTTDFLKGNIYNLNSIYDLSLENTSTENVLSQTAQTEIKKCDWVLTFAMTNYDYTYIPGTGVSSGVNYYTKTLVTNVSLMRLKFKSDRVTYNLGVIDNFQSGSTNPVGVYENNKFQDIMKIMLLLILLVLVCIFIGPLFSVLFTLIWPFIRLIFKVILKTLIFVLTLPFKAIRFLFWSKKT